MKRCSYCGKIISKHESFCEYCHKSQLVNSKQIYPTQHNSAGTFYAIYSTCTFILTIIIGILLYDIKIPLSKDISISIMYVIWIIGGDISYLLFTISSILKTQDKTNDEIYLLKTRLEQLSKNDSNKRFSNGNKHVRPQAEQTYDILFCPNCGESQSPGMAVCWKCGATLGGESKSVETADSDKSTDWAETADLLDDDKAPRVSGKCSYCGKRRDDLYYVRITDNTGSHYEKICKNCAHVNDLGKKD